MKQRFIPRQWIKHFDGFYKRVKIKCTSFLTSHSKEAIDKILKCAPEMRKDMAVYTLSKVNEKSVARRLSGDKAIEVQDHMGLELR